MVVIIRVYSPMSLWGKKSARSFGNARRCSHVVLYTGDDLADSDDVTRFAPVLDQRAFVPLFGFSGGPKTARIRSVSSGTYFVPVRYYAAPRRPFLRACDREGSI